MKKIYILLSLICFCVINADAQKNQKPEPNYWDFQDQGLELIPDPTEALTEELLENNPDLMKEYQDQLKQLEIDGFTKDGGANCSTSFSCDEVMSVAVVFHYIYGDNTYSTFIDTEEYIQNTVMAAVNNYFNPDGSLDDNLGACYANTAPSGNCFNFCLATNDHPNSSGLAVGEAAIMQYQVTDAQIDNIADFEPGNAQTNLIHSIAPAWNTCEYLNVYVVPNLLPPTNGFVIAGYTYLPNGGNAQFNSIYMDWDFTTGGTTLAHEIGHWLGLEHTWGSNNGCGDEDYYLGDTNCPINDTFTQDDSNISDACPGAANACNSSSCGTPDNFYNIMNYTNCAASQQFFTIEQYCYMYNTLNGGVTIGCRDDLNPASASKCGNCTLELVSSEASCNATETNYDACVTISGSGTYNLTASNSLQTFTNVSPTPAGTEYCFTGYNVATNPQATITITDPNETNCEEIVTLAAPCSPQQCPEYNDGTIDLTTVCSGEQVIMTIPQSCSVTPAGFDVIVCWDQWGSQENFFEVIDESNNTVIFTAAPTAAENETCVTYNVSGLSTTGSYTVTIYDSYGDGMYNATCFGGASDGTTQVNDAVSGAILLPENVFEAQDGDGDGNTCEDTNADGPISESYTGLVPTGVEVSLETVEILINGVVVNSFPNDAPCADETLGAILTTANVCQPEVLTVGYNIICELTNSSIAAAEFLVDVYPQPTNDVNDMVAIDYSNAACGNCTPEIVYLADCNPVAVTVTETTSAVDGQIGTASFDVDFNGLNAGACCTATVDTLFASIAGESLDGDGNGCVDGQGTEDFFTFNFPALPNGANVNDAITTYDNIGLGDINIGELCFSLNTPDDRIILIQIFNDPNVGDNTNGGGVWTGTAYGGSDGTGANIVSTCFNLNGDFFAGNSLNDFYIRILEGTCITDGTPVPTGAIVTGITLEVYVGNGLTTCDYTLDVPYNCECTAECSLTDAQITIDDCNDNGTPLDPADDTFNFFLNPIGTNQGATYTVSGGALAAPIIGNTYGSNVTFGPYLISDWGAGVAQTITITDIDDPNCTITAEVIAPEDCSTECPVIINAGTSSPVCGGQNFSITSFAASLSSDFPEFLLAYDLDVSTPASTTEVIDGLTGGPSDPGDIEAYGEFVDNTGIGTLGITDLSDIIGFNNNACNVAEIDIYFIPAVSATNSISTVCDISAPVRVTFYPNFNIVTANDGSCNPVAYLELLNSDGTGAVVDTCSVIGDPLSTSCTEDLTYDFGGYDISNVGSSFVPLNDGAACVTGDISGTVTCGQFTATETFTVCEGESYDYNGTLILGGTSQNISTIEANGCELITTVTVNTFTPTADISETYEGCTGDGYSYTSPSGIVYDETNPSGTETIQDANNCDYAVTVNLVFNALTADINETYEGCSGDGYSYTSPSGTVYDETNPSGTETIQDANNCDYTVTVNLVFNALTADISETYEGCSGDGYSYTSPSGTVYDETNPTGTETLQDANNCDYTVTVNLVFNTLTADITEAYEGCSGDGYSYTSPSGTVYDETNPSGTETVQDANNCDYTVTVNLVFNALTADINETYEGCSGDGYAYTSPSGTVYDETNPSGIETIQDANNCDYTVTVNLVFNALTADINETYEGCSGDGYSYTSPSGTVYDETNPTGIETLQDGNNCDYTVTVDLVFNSLTPDGNESYNGCTGDGYLVIVNGVTYDETNPTGTETLQDANGCDYDITIDLVFNSLTADITETYEGCSGDGYVYASPSGTVYDEANPTGTETLQDGNGCDYNVLVDLVFNSLTADITETYVGCESDGYSYTSPSGTVYDENNPTGTETLQDGNGCDYTVTVSLTYEVCVDPCENVTDVNETYEGCSGDGYSFTSPNGTIYDENNPSGSESVIDGNNCTYQLTVDLVFNTLTADINETYEGCSGDGYSVDVNGTTYNEINPSGTEVLTDANGCNYEVVIDLVFNELTPNGTETYVGCSGDGYSVEVNGTTYNEANSNGVETLQDANGCDYTITVDLLFNSLAADITETYEGCSGDGYSVDVNGTTYNEINPSGTEVLTDENGCNYNVNIDLVFNDLTQDETETYTGCLGDGYAILVNGVTYDETNPSGSETLTDGNGCNYNVTIDLTFEDCVDPCENVSDVNETYVGCSGDGYSFTSPNGTVYDESNPSGTESITDGNNCTYELTIDLNFNALTEDGSETYEGCSGDGYSVEVNGVNYDETNPIGSEVLTDANGCYYTITIDLVFNDLTADVDEIYTGCVGDGYSIEVNGTTYDESNPSGSEILQDANGCDYMVNIDLVFDTCTDPCDSVTDQTETYEGCSGDGYSIEVNGVTYDETNPVGSETLTDGNDCEYTVTIDLVFNELSPDVDETYEGCSGDGYSVEINGTIYDEVNPTGTETLQDANGCDYMVNIDLVFDTCTNPCDSVTDQAETYEGCSGDGYSIEVNGVTYDETNPVGSETLTDGNDCEYTVTIDLIFNELTPDIDETYTGCLGDAYSVEVNGTTYDESNPSGTETLQDANGCDYAVIISLIFEDCSVECDLIASIDKSNDLDCTNSNVTLIAEFSSSASNGVQYLWSTGETANAIDVTEAGTYSVTITDGNDCVETASIEVVDNGGDLPSAGDDNAITLCSNDASINLNSLINGESNGNWSEGPSIDLTGLADGDYFYVYSVSNECGTDEALITVTLIACAEPEISIADPCSCSNELNYILNNVNYVHEVITITSPPGQTWTLQGFSSNGLFNDMGGTVTLSGLTGVEVSSGVYEVEVYYIPENGYTATFNNGEGDSLSIGATGEDCICSEERGSISSTVWGDENRDGIFDEDEEGIEGIEVFIQYPDGTIDIVVTDENGNFIFTDLLPGEYTITVGAAPNGMEVTTENSIVVTLGGGEDINLNFSFGFAMEEVDCNELLVQVSGECIEDGAEYNVSITIDGGTLGNEGFLISSSTSSLNGTVVTGSVIDGPFDNGTPYDYTISSVSNPECNATYGVTIFECTVTAIELLRFEGETLDSGNLLTWETASEIDNDYFTLQRSIDGINFEIIGEINASNNINGDHYSFMDEEMYEGARFYRLLSTDIYNNTEIESDIIELSRAALPVNVYPVPASDQITIEFLGNVNSELNIVVYGVDGRVVLESSAIAVNNSVDINIQSLSVGAYWLQISDNDSQIRTVRFIKE